MAGLPQTQQMPQNHVNSANYTINELEKIGDFIVKSGLFGITKKEQAVALLLLAQSEGLHPMQAVKKYHIVQGKPVKKAETMLAEFLKAGGRVKWHRLDNEVAEATFTAPNGDSIKIKWTIQDAEKITTTTFDKQGNKVVKKLTDKDNWRNYPRAMLRSRVISEGIRTVFPEITEGIYTPEEVIDMPVDVDIENSPVQSEQEVIENNNKETEDEKSKNEWTIQEIKKIIKPELKEIFSKLKLKTSEIIALFEKFNGNQEEILKQLTSESTEKENNPFFD